MVTVAISLGAAGYNHFKKPSVNSTHPHNLVVDVGHPIAGPCLVR
jgi:hypothetical protein